MAENKIKEHLQHMSYFDLISKEPVNKKNQSIKKLSEELFEKEMQ